LGQKKLEINHSKTELLLNRKKPQTINLTAPTTSDFRAQETKMSKAADMAKTTTKGGFHYLLGLVISTVISSVGTIFIAKMMGDDLYGLYGIVLNVPNIIVIFRDWGINSAMVRYTAQYRAEDRTPEIRSIFFSGILFEIIVGIILSVVSFTISGYLATDIYNRPEIASLLQLASITILTSGLITAATAAFTGIEKMEYNSIMLICQSVIKTFLVIVLVALGFGTSGAVVGYTVGTVVAGTIGLAFTLVIFKKLPKPFTFKLEIREYIKEMLKFGLPLSVAAIVGSFLAQFYIFLLPIYYIGDNSTLGNYYIAMNFVVLISFFAIPVTSMLFPAFSKLDAHRENATLKNVFQFSIKYASLLVVPVATLVMSLAEPAVTTLFGDAYALAPLFLAGLSINYLFTAFGSLSISNLINSQGQTNFQLKLNLLTAAIGFPMGYLLIMQFGVIGLIATSLIAGLPSLIISIVWVKKKYNFTIDWNSSARILTSSAIAAVLTYLLITYLAYASLVRLAIGAVFYVIVLIAALLLTRAISQSDIYSLKSMTIGLGPITKILWIVFDVIRKIMAMLKLP
jgi:O-antigen/teichoic acid export membrane protein